jgi:hypothetical protein
MVDQVLARLGIKAPQVFVRKGPPQQRGVIQPTGVWWGIEDPQARMPGPVCVGVVGNVRRVSTIIEKGPFSMIEKSPTPRVTGCPA